MDMEGDFCVFSASTEDLIAIRQLDATRSPLIRPDTYAYMAPMIPLLTISILFSFASQIHAEERKSCPPGKHWVSAYVQPTYRTASGKLIREHKVSAHCRKNPDGYNKWKKTLSNGRPRFWGFSSEKSKKWTISEKERVLEDLAALPQLLLDQGAEKIYRMTESVVGGVLATTNTALREIVLYDVAFKGKHSLAHILAHEFSHLLYENLSGQLKREYAKIAQWEKRITKSGIVTYLPGRSKNQYVDANARQSRDEDFSYNIEYYLFKPDELKRTALSVYRWVDKNFGTRLKAKGGK